MHSGIGNKTAQIDAEGRVTRWEYDGMGREIARILPEGQRETKAYDEAGQLVSSTDFNGRTTGYDYDANGRILRLDYPQDADVVFAYDGNGQRIEVRDGRGVSTRQYDARGRLSAVNDADGGQIAYEYDAAGNLQARILPSQSLVYLHDARNRLTQVLRTGEGELAQTTRFGYDASGRHASMLGAEGTASEYRYDRRGRLASLIKRTAAGLLLASMNYTVDASGMRTGVEEADAAGISRTVGYQYDGVKRLVEEVVGHRDAARDRISQWTYDRVGNRLTQTVAAGAASAVTTRYVYDGNDRLLSESSPSGTASYRYDDNGNTLAKSGAGESTTYRYSDANRLVEARTPEATITYAYDADGLRVAQTVVPALGAATTTWYVQDPAYAYAQVVEQYESEGSGPKRLAASYAFADELLSQTRYDQAGSPTTNYVQADGFSSTRWVTDSAGAITDAIDYDAFGVEIGREGSTAVEHLYRGEAFDDVTGLYYLRARWMDPSAGRMRGMDTWGGKACTPISLHKFAYANDDPINYFDPSGNVALMTELLFGSNIQLTGRRVEYSNKAQKAYSALKRICESVDSIGGKLASSARHHVVPDFLRGAALKKRFDDVFVMRLDHAAHNQFHVLLDYALRMNNFMGRSGKVRGMKPTQYYEDLYSRNPAARSDVFAILMDVSELFDSICQDSHRGKSLAKRVKDMKGLID